MDEKFSMLLSNKENAFIVAKHWFIKLVSL